MVKLIPIFIEGKKWVQLSQLSSEQVLALKSWLPVNCIKNVLFEGIELTDCLDFETYDYWFKAQQMVEQKQPLLEF